MLPEGATLASPDTERVQGAGPGEGEQGDLESVSSPSEILTTFCEITALSCTVLTRSLVLAAGQFCHPHQL